VPYRLVMMNSEKQVRTRCLLIRHQASALMRRRTGAMAAGAPMARTAMVIRTARMTCQVSSSHPAVMATMMAISGSHHQITRRTGQTVTTTEAMAPRNAPMIPATITAVKTGHMVDRMSSARMAALMVTTQKTTLAIRA
jgi:hypothetical protein